VFHCVITSIQGKKCDLAISDIETVEKRTTEVHIALAPTKNMDRTEFFIEKAVELGIEKISFIQTFHSERKTLKMDRIEKVAIAALKQSGKLYLPTLHDMQPIAEWLENIGDQETYIAHLEEGTIKNIWNTKLPSTSVCILIGPEGDFSKDEIERCKGIGIIPISLGPYRLRTETAAITACLALNKAFYETA
jgi:16S rRNA (uracil1498-N3)-methyltransferase